VILPEYTSDIKANDARSSAALFFLTASLRLRSPGESALSVRLCVFFLLDHGVNLWQTSLSNGTFAIEPA